MLVNSHDRNSDVGTLKKFRLEVSARLLFRCCIGVHGVGFSDFFGVG